MLRRSQSLLNVVYGIQGLECWEGGVDGNHKTPIPRHQHSSLENRKQNSVLMTAEDVENPAKRPSVKINQQNYYANMISLKLLFFITLNYYILHMYLAP